MTAPHEACTAILMIEAILGHQNYIRAKSLLTLAYFAFVFVFGALIALIWRKK
jgi:hypothetical protein